MQKFRFLYFFKNILLLLAFCPSLIWGNEARQKLDSICKIVESRKGENIHATFYEGFGYLYDIDDPEVSLAFFDKYIENSRDRNNVFLEGDGRTYKLSTLYNYRLFDRFDKSIQDDLNFCKKHELWSFFGEMQALYVLRYTGENKFEEAIKVTQEYYEDSRSRNDIYGMGVALSYMGWSYYNMKQFDKSVEVISEAVEYLEEAKKTNGIQYVFNELVTTYNHLFEAFRLNYSETSKQEETLKKLEQLLIENREHMSEEFSSRFWRGVYLSYVRLYRDIGDYENVEKYIELALPKINDIIGWVSFCEAVVPYYTCSGQFEKGFATLEEMERLYPDNIQDNTKELFLEFRIDLYSMQENYKEAFFIQKQLQQLQDSINSVEINAKLDELHTVYEVDKLTAEKKIHRQRWMIGIVVCFLLATALIIYIVYSRRLRQRNLSLYKQIQELSRKEKAVETCFLSKPVETLSREMQLYRQLSECMKTEKLFIDSDLNRKKLADHLGTNESYLATAIRQGSGQTFSDYLSNLRLNYALELLNDSPEITFEAIAIDSGYGSYSQFFRSFSKKYGISPSEYRKLAMKKA